MRRSPLLHEDEQAIDALAELSASEVHRGLGVDDGRLAGFLSITDLARALELGRPNTGRAAQAVLDAGRGVLQPGLANDGSARARTARWSLHRRVGPPAWRTPPSWYQVSGEDRKIPPDLEREFADRMNATTISLDAGHASMVSRPSEIAEVILQAVHAGVPA